MKKKKKTTDENLYQISDLPAEEVINVGNKKQSKKKTRRNRENRRKKNRT